MAKGEKRKAPDAADDWLFEDEEVVHSWSGITVTTYRVCYHVAGSGQQSFVSLVLSQIDGTAFRRVHFPWLLVLAVVFALLGAVGTTIRDGTALTVIGVVSAALCAASYVATRNVAVSIAAGTMRIEQTVPGGGSHVAKARALLQSIDDACARIRRTKRAAGTQAA